MTGLKLRHASTQDQTPANAAPAKIRSRKLQLLASLPFSCACLSAPGRAFPLQVAFLIDVPGQGFTGG